MGGAALPRPPPVPVEDHADVPRNRGIPEFPREATLVGPVGRLRQRSCESVGEPHEGEIYAALLGRRDDTTGERSYGLRQARRENHEGPRRHGGALRRTNSE